MKKSYNEDIAALKKEAHRANVSWRSKLARKVSRIMDFKGLRQPAALLVSFRAIFNLMK